MPNIVRPSIKSVVEELRHPRASLVDRSWQAQLPLFLALIFCFWWIYYRYCGDKLILRFLPAAGRREIQRKKKTDRDFESACRANGTAFTHAAITSPIALLTLIRLNSDHYFAESKLFDVSALLMGGYFVWDLILCCIHYRTFGPTFLLHALLSVSAIFVQLNAKEMRTSWIAAALMATEISTPFLHLRWFLLKGGQSAGWYFQLVNAVFLLLYVGYRLIGIEMICIIPYTRELLFTNEFAGSPRLWFQAVVGWVWTVLAYYWGLLLAKSQWKALTRRREREHAN